MRSAAGSDGLPAAALDVAAIAVEGATDHLFGRPFDANPYSRELAADAWQAWRFGWLEASSFREAREQEERERWLRP